MNEKFLLKKHEEILEYLLKYKKENSYFTFSPRKNHNGHKENILKCRLCKGYWFQGAEDYIFVALYHRGCKDNKTKTIGFEFRGDVQYIEIVYKKVQGITSKEEELYQNLLAYLEKSPEIKEIQKKHEKKYFAVFKSSNLKDNLKYFLTIFKPYVDKLIKENGLEKDFFISQDELNQRLNEIKKVKNNLLKIGVNMELKEKETTINNRIRNVLLYGVPGVGKTYNTKKLISLLETKQEEKDIFAQIEENSLNDNKEANQLVENINSRVKFITFHQSFGYEDFIEGFRPNDNGEIKLRNGVFKDLCENAKKDLEKNYYLVIDEINRGNISKIFGELITLIEEDKRGSLHVTLPYSKEEFSIPSNIYIIGTMNSTDKSIALIDIALRRRFTFIQMTPSPELVKYENAKNLMIDLNEKLDSECQIGHSYFMNIENEKELDFTCKYKIKPLLEEYFYGDKEELYEVLDILKPHF